MSGYTGAHKPQADGRCEHRWANRVTRLVACGFADGYAQGRAAADAAASLRLLDAMEAQDADRAIGTVPGARRWLAVFDDDGRPGGCFYWAVFGPLAVAIVLFAWWVAWQ